MAKRGQGATTRSQAGVSKVEREKGPLGWLVPMLEEAYAKLRPKEEAEAEAAAIERRAACTTVSAALERGEAPPPAAPLADLPSRIGRTSCANIILKMRMPGAKALVR